MTSRERVVKTLKHGEPDRVPLDLGGTESSGMTGIAYNKLRVRLGLAPGRSQVFDMAQQVVKIEDDVRRMLEIDTVPLVLEPRTWKPFRLPDGSACEIPGTWNPRKENGDWVVRDEGETSSRGCRRTAFTSTRRSPRWRASRSFPSLTGTPGRSRRSTGPATPTNRRRTLRHAHAHSTRRRTSPSWRTCVCTFWRPGKYEKFAGWGDIGFRNPAR